MKLRNLLICITAGTAVAGIGNAQDKAPDPEIFEFEHVSCTGEPNEIRIVVNGVKESIGLISVDLYSADNEKFLRGRHKIGRARAAAKSPRTNLCITAPESGDFAIAIYHDENANKTLDKGAFGIPSEPWGISRNPKIRFSRPHVDQALFPVPSTGADILINLN